MVSLFNLFHHLWLLSTIFQYFCFTFKKKLKERCYDSGNKFFSFEQKSEIEVNYVFEKHL